MNQIKWATECTWYTPNLKANSKIFQIWADIGFVVGKSSFARKKLTPNIYFVHFNFLKYPAMQ